MQASDQIRIMISLTALHLLPGEAVCGQLRPCIPFAWRRQTCLHNPLDVQLSADTAGHKWVAAAMQAAA